MATGRSDGVVGVVCIAIFGDQVCLLYEDYRGGREFLLMILLKSSGKGSLTTKIASIIAVAALTNVINAVGDFVNGYRRLFPKGAIPCAEWNSQGEEKQNH